MNSIRTVRLESWCIVGDPRSDVYTPPECRRPCLHGIGYGHPLHDDGSPITSTAIVRLETSRNYVVTASGTRYKLGTPDPKYAREYPNPRRRLYNDLRTHTRS